MAERATGGGRHAGAEHGAATATTAAATSSGVVGFMIMCVGRPIRCARGLRAAGLRRVRTRAWRAGTGAGLLVVVGLQFVGPGERAVRSELGVVVLVEILGSDVLERHLLVDLLANLDDLV